MGLFDKIFSKQKIEPQQPERLITAEEALKASDEKMHSLRFDKEQALCTDITASITIVMNEIQNLEQANIKGEVDQRLEQVAKQSREQLIKTLRIILSNVNIKTADFVSIKSTHESLTNSIKQITAGNMKHSYYTSLLWKKQMTELGKSISRLTELTAQLGGNIDSKESSIAPYKEFVSLNKDEKKFIKEIKDLETKLGQVGDQKQVVDKRIEETEKQLKEVTIPAVPAELTNRKQALRSEIYSYLAPFSRVFRKYNKMGAFERPVAEVLDDYEKDLIKAALADKDNKILLVLDDIEKMINGNELKLKESVRQKSISLIAEIRAGKLQTAVAKYKEVAAEIDKESEKIRPAEKQKQTLKDELDNSKQRQRRNSDEKSATEKELNRKKKELEQTQKQMQQKLKQISLLST